MSFQYPLIAGAFLLVALPVLIHLINMMRHKRVKWAAMDFLLIAYKRSRSYIWLKQFLLLLARMLAIAAVVAILAQMKFSSDSMNFGGKPTHHYVLLDDSLSMSDKEGGEPAFQKAKQAAIDLASGAARSSNQIYTLVRFSKARGLEKQDEQHKSATVSAEKVADINAEKLPYIGGGSGGFQAFQRELDEKLKGLHPTDVSVGPAAALEFVSTLIQGNSEERAIVSIISDFRQSDWQAAAAYREVLSKLKADNVEIQLIPCVKQARANLAITYLAPTEGTRAIGVPLQVEVKVKNFGTTAAVNVPLEVRAVYFDKKNLNPKQPEALPAVRGRPESVVIARIEPGAVYEGLVAVSSPIAGPQVVQAELLVPDAVEADNRRWAVVDFPDRVPTLIVDGDPDQNNEYYLSFLFAPHERVRTGVRPEAQPARFLDASTAEELNAYSVIWLLDVKELSDRAVANLTEYVKAGGGLAVFLGPQCSVNFYNKLYAGGEGLFPIPLERREQLPPRASAAADFRIEKHPMLGNLFREGVASQMIVAEYFSTKPGWTPSPNSGVTIPATLRNGAPFIVERRFGEGRVVAVTSTLSPLWNNLALHGLTAATLLDIQAYLGSARKPEPPHSAGTPLSFELAKAGFLPEFTLVGREAAPAGKDEDKTDPKKTTGDPAANNSAMRSFLAVTRRWDGAMGNASDAQKPPTGEAAPSPSPNPTASPSDKTEKATVTLGGFTEAGLPNGETDRAGVYDAWLTANDGQRQVRRFAVNVDTQESDLEYYDSQKLSTALHPVTVNIHQSEDVRKMPPVDDPESSLGKWLLYGLIFLLLGEQLLAYSASYHKARGVSR